LSLLLRITQLLASLVQIEISSVGSKYAIPNPLLAAFWCPHSNLLRREGTSDSSTAAFILLAAALRAPAVSDRPEFLDLCSDARDDFLSGFMDRFPYLSVHVDPF
jgi:hypothetical protein